MKTYSQRAVCVVPLVFRACVLASVLSMTTAACCCVSGGCCLQIVVTCLLTQMNYLNKSLDLFNTAIVSPIYYVMFTLLTIIASVIMFQVCGWGSVPQKMFPRRLLCDAVPCKASRTTFVLAWFMHSDTCRSHCTYAPPWLC